jgi:hypothetical protein
VIKGKKAGRGLDRDQLLTDFEALNALVKKRVFLSAVVVVVVVVVFLAGAAAAATLIKVKKAVQ